MSSSHKRPLIPREGLFTADAISSLVRKTVLNPALTVPLFLLLTQTAAGRSLAHSNDQWFRRLKIAAVLGLISRTSDLLSWGAQNNWKKDKYKWDDEVIIVTGGCGGIGEKIVRDLVARAPGAKVVVLDLLEWKGEKPTNVSVFNCDLSSSASIKDVAARIRSEVGTPTVLINNAGICRGKTLLDATEKDIRLTYDVNVMSHFWLAKEFLPDMIRNNHGHIVTVASVGAYVQAPQLVDYNSSKAAALSFHEGLGLELVHRYNAPLVRTSLVTQGYVRTPLFEGYASDSRVMFPALHPETVAEAIVDQVLKGESGHIVLPKTYNLITANRGWAPWLQSNLRKKTANLMGNYNGRQVMDPNVKKA